MACITLFQWIMPTPASLNYKRNCLSFNLHGIPSQQPQPQAAYFAPLVLSVVDPDRSFFNSLCLPPNGSWKALLSFCFGSWTRDTCSTKNTEQPCPAKVSLVHHPQLVSPQFINKYNIYVRISKNKPFSLNTPQIHTLFCSFSSTNVISPSFVNPSIETESLEFGAWKLNSSWVWTTHSQLWINQLFKKPVKQHIITWARLSKYWTI